MGTVEGVEVKGVAASCLALSLPSPPAGFPLLRAPLLSGALYLQMTKSLQLVLLPWCKGLLGQFSRLSSLG